MKHLLFAASILFFAAAAHASGDNVYPFGIQAELSAGAGSATIGNTDGTNANYSVLSVQGRGLIPLIGDDPGSLFHTDLVGGIKYLDLQNTGSIGSEKETANMIGPGLGLQMRLARFFAGAEYNFMLARHYAIGPSSREIDYSMTTLTYYGGFFIPFGQLAVGLNYSVSSGSVPHSSTGLSKDSPYQDQTFWLQFTYSTGASFTNFLKLLF